MLCQKLLNKEIYIIPIGKYSMVYAPLTRSLCLYEGSVGFDDIDKEFLIDATDPNKIPDFVKNGFMSDRKKMKLRINITNRCNLHCSYCSIGNNYNSEDLNLELGKLILSKLTEHAVDSKMDEVELTFSGGEPTLKIDLLKQLIRFINGNLSTKIPFSIRILTNGFFSEDAIVPILSSVNGIQISWDGDQVGNPRYGKHSEISKRVWNNIKFLIGKGISPNILTVISEYNCGYIEEIVDSLYGLGLENISLVFRDKLGRAAGNESWDCEKFKEAYTRLWKKYRAKNIDVNLAGTDIHSMSIYPCSIACPNYSVSPKGHISSCTVTFNDKRRIADLFKIGEVKNDNLILNAKSINSMKKYNVFNFHGCKDCFAKWHCRGGCIYAKDGKWFDPLKPVLCDLIRKIIAEKLMTIAKEVNS